MSLDALLRGDRAPAVLGLPPGADLLRTAADAAADGWRVVVLDGAAATGKEEFLIVAARAFDLPEWFGGTWDSLADCLGDLQWLPAERWLVLWDEVDVLEHADPRAVQVALDVLDEAVEEWAARGRAFAALLRPAPDGIPYL